MNFAQSNLYQLFCSLTREEVKELEKAVHSPFFNYRNEEIRLFEFLKSAAKKSRNTITGEEVSQYVLETRKPDLVKLRNVMTYLTRIINRVIVIAETEQNEAQKRLLLTASLRRRKLDKLFLENYRQTSHYLQDEAAIAPDTYYRQLQLHTEYYTHSISGRKAKNEDLQKLSEDLDMFYLIQKLKHGCNILSYKNLFGFEHQPNILEELKLLIERKNMLVNPLAKLLYYNYLCLSEPDNEAHFVQLKAALLQQNKRIDIKELRDIFTLAVNYCIKRLNTGGQKYYREVFEIYQAGLRETVFEEDGKLSPFTYKNISAIAIGLREFKWVHTFIEEYKDKLPALYSEGFYAYCLARYHFAKGSYDHAAHLLREVDIKEQFTDLDARVLLIKTYYEQDEFSLLNYSLENLKQQLKRKKLQTYHQAVYGNFIKMAARLVRLANYDKKARQAFAKKIESLSQVAEKGWLLSKVK